MQSVLQNADELTFNFRL